MKICFFNCSYSPDLSATGQLLTELAENLVEVAELLEDFGSDADVHRHDNQGCWYRFLIDVRTYEDQLCARQGREL